MHYYAHRPPCVVWLEWDGFYADYSLDQPQVVVRDRLVLDANAAARSHKIEPGMGVPLVRTLCPGCLHKAWLESDTTEKQSQWLDVCVSFSDRIEPIDGHIAAVDLTGHPDPLDIASRLNSRLMKELPHRLSYGFGPVKWLARLAMRHEVGTLALREPAAFLSVLPVCDLLPVDPEHRERLLALGCKTVGEVAALPVSVLRSQFGKDGASVALAARGQTPDPVNPSYPKGSLRESFLFDGAVDDAESLDRALYATAKRIAARLKGRQSAHVRLEAKGEDGRIKTTERRLTRPVHNAPTLLAAARALLAQSRLCEPVSALCLQLSNLEQANAVQEGFFVQKVDRGAQQVVSGLNDAFGEGAVTLAAKVEVPRRQLVIKEWQRATGWR